MASRIARKSTARPIDTGLRVRELPGAVFFGVPRRHFHVTDRFGATRELDATSVTDIDPESLQYAIRLNRICADYERDDCQEALWADLQEMGFESNEISRCVTNPKRITCGGYLPAGCDPKSCQF
jgi:hypothetical protein